MKRDYQGVFTLDDLEGLVQEIKNGPDEVGFDVETSYSSPENVAKRSLDTTHPDFFVTGFSITNDISWARYIPLRHEDNQVFDTKEVWEKFRPILEEKSIVAHNYAFERAALYSVGRSGDANGPIIPKKLGHDTMLLANSLACFNAVGLKYLTGEVLGVKQTEYWELFGDVVLNKDGKPSKAAIDRQRFSQLKVNQAVIDYGCDDSALCLELLNILLPRLQQEAAQLRNYAVDMSTMTLLTEMQEHGISFDWARLEEANAQGKAFIPILEQYVRNNLALLTVDPDVKALARSLNFNSPKQKQELLYKGFGMKTDRKTNTGAMSTDAKTLQILSKQHPEIKGMVYVTEARKMMSSFTQKYLNDYAESHDFKVHPTFRIASDGVDSAGGTITGRFSSSNPNIQQATSKWLWSLKQDEEGKHSTEGRNGYEYWGGSFKRLFTASDGKYLLYFDYSNQEMRMLAGIAREPVLMQMFANNEDIHRKTASLIYGIPISEVTAEQRTKAKTTGFATSYGSGVKGIADLLAISFDEAEDLVNRYKSQFPAVANWDSASRVFGIQNGYIRTWTGRRIPLKNAHSSNPGLVAASERAAVNYQIQGSAADYVKYAMLRAKKMLQAENLWGPDKVMLVINVHDSLGFECDNSIDPNRVREILHKAVVYSVQEVLPTCNYTFPTFSVDWELGKCWGDAVDGGGMYDWEEDQKAVWNDEADQWMVEGAEPTFIDLQPPSRESEKVSITELEF